MAKIILKDYLKERGIKHQFLLEQVRLSQPQFSKLINGKTTGIQFDILEDICRALKCEITDILILDKDSN